MKARMVSGRVHHALNLAIVIGLPAQYYTAGLVVFGVTTFEPHRVVGSLLILAGLQSLSAAAIAQRPHADWKLALWLFLLLFLQPALAFAPRTSLPALAALHAVNGLFAFALALAIARGARQLRPVPAPG